MTKLHRLSFFLISTSVFLLCSCPNNAGNKGTSNPDDIIPGPDSNPRLSLIHTASVNNKGETGKYVTVKNFDGEGKEIFEAGHEAETAYIDIKLQTEVSASPNYDFSISMQNENTFEPPVTLERGKDTESGFFFGKMVLSEGSNLISIKVSSIDLTQDKTYKITINYSGGSKSTEEIISGIYCPAQRKPSEGEKPEYVWVIFGEGG